MIRYIKDFFVSKNSLLILQDKMTLESQELFEKQIEEIRAYYSIVPLSKIIERLHKKKSQGYAAIYFKNPRVSLFNLTIPYLVAEKIPFSIGLRSDCVGLNNLPSEEEYKPEDIPKLNPGDFFATWGKLLQLNPIYTEFGVYLIDSNLSKNKDEISYLETQTKRKITYGYSDSAGFDALTCKELGLMGLVTSKMGVIERSSDPYQLCHWR
jgi:hypothetical protein